MDHKLCIVDADSIIYKVSYTDKELNDCIDLMHGYINRIKNKCNCDYYIFTVEGKGNFRLKYDPHYKSHRPTEKPMYFQDLKNVLIVEYEALISVNIETDDYCSLLMEQCKHLNPILAHIDKDLNQIQGMHYNYGKDTFFEIDEKLSYYWLAFQLLTGDSVDSKITGIKNIGKVKANAILDNVENYKDYIGVVLNKYIEVYGYNGIELFYKNYKILSLLRTYKPLNNKIKKMIEFYNGV